MIYYIIIINLISIIVCYIDKHNAIKSKYRVPENFLIYLSLIGGVFGFVIGMILFHHKTKKIKFILLEPIFLIIWIYIIIVL